MNHSKKCKRIFQTNFAAEDMKFVIQLEEKDIYLWLLKRQTGEYRGSRKNTRHNIREKWRQLTVSPTFSLSQSLRSPSAQRILGKYPPLAQLSWLSVSDFVPYMHFIFFSIV